MHLHHKEIGSLIATVRNNLRASSDYAQLADLVDALRKPFKEAVPPDRTVAEKLAKVYQALPTFDRTTEKKRKPEHQAKICLGAALCCLDIPTVLDPPSIGWLLGRTRDRLEEVAETDSDLKPWAVSARTQRSLFNEDASPSANYDDVIKAIEGAIEHIPPFDPQKDELSPADHARIILFATLAALDPDGHRILS